MLFRNTSSRYSSFIRVIGYGLKDGGTQPPGTWLWLVVNASRPALELPQRYIQWTSGIFFLMLEGHEREGYDV